MLGSVAFAFSVKALEIAPAAFLVLLLVGAALLGPHNKLPGRGNAPPPMKSLGKMPILQVELAGDAKDLDQVLTPGDLERNINDAPKGKNFDTFLFIPASSGLLVFVCLIAANGDGRGHAMRIPVNLASVPLAAARDCLRTPGLPQRSTFTKTKALCVRLDRKVEQPWLIHLKLRVQRSRSLPKALPCESSPYWTKEREAAGPSRKRRGI